MKPRETNTARTLAASENRPVTRPTGNPIRMQDRERKLQLSGPMHEGVRRVEWNDLKEQAILAFESGLLPKTIDTRQKAITIALMGSELGLSPMQALCGIYVVNGMTALRGSLMLRLIYERIAGARITILTPPENADSECTVEMQRPQGKPLIFRFTLDDAAKAGFLNKPVWQQHTSTMLRWAAIRTGARIVFADAIAGCYMEDEIPVNATLSHVENEMAANIPVVPATVAEPEEKFGATPSLKAKEAEPAATPELGQWMPPRTELRGLPPKETSVTEKQVKRLFAIAHQKNWSRQRIAATMADWFQKREPEELTRSEYDELCNFLLSQ